MFSPSCVVAIFRFSCAAYRAADARCALLMLIREKLTRPHTDRESHRNVEFGHWVTRGVRERMPGRTSRAKQTEVRAFFVKTVYDPLERKAPVDDVLPPKNVFKDQRVLPKVPAIPFPEPPTHPVTRPSEEEETPEPEPEPEPDTPTE